MITTVGELKKKLADLSDNLPLEFWVLEQDSPLRMVTVEQSGDIRTPDNQVAEVILKPAK